METSNNSADHSRMKSNPSRKKMLTQTRQFVTKLFFWKRKKPKSQPEISVDMSIDKSVRHHIYQDETSNDSLWYDSEQFADQSKKDRVIIKSDSKEEQSWYIEESEFKLLSAAAQLEDSLNECKQELIQLKQRAVKLQIEDVHCVQLGDAFLIKSMSAEPRLELWLSERLKADRATEKKLQAVLEAGKLNLQRLNRLMAERIHSKTQ